MNLLLLFPDDLTSQGQAVIKGRRCRHLLADPEIKAGQRLITGLVNEKIGSGIITSTRPDQIELEFQLHSPPPRPSPVILILALPRPKVLSRTLAAAVSLGIKDIFLVNSVNVQKSYWQSPHLEAAAIEEQLFLGLEQARDTIMPRLHWRRFFRDLAEQDLPRLGKETRALIAAPAPDSIVPASNTEPTTLVIGPETGFSIDETRTFHEAGFQPYSLGPRILRVETALPALVSRLTPSL